MSSRKRVLSARLRSGVAALLLILSSTLNPQAQQATPGRASAERAGGVDIAVNPARLQAVDIIKAEISQAKKYTYAGNRVSVWTAAADALWKHDPDAARETLRTAFEELKRVAPPKRDGENDTQLGLRTLDLRDRLRTVCLSFNC